MKRGDSFISTDATNQVAAALLISALAYIK
jgi:hypothetical protein